MARRSPGFALSLSIGLALFASHSGECDERMLLTALEGRSFERVRTDRAGRESGRARLDVGRLETGAAGTRLAVTITLYESDGRERRLSSSWSCEPAQAGMTMYALVFAPELAKPRLRVESEGDPIVYPQTLPEGGKLPDLSLELRAQGGFLSLLGARSRIAVRDRRATMGTPSGGSSATDASYVIRSRIDARGYAAGIRVRHVEYLSAETVDPATGLVEQTLKAEDGTVWTLRRLPADEPASGALAARGGT